MIVHVTNSGGDLGVRILYTNQNELIFVLIDSYRKIILISKYLVVELEYLMAVRRNGALQMMDGVVSIYFYCFK